MSLVHCVLIDFQTYSKCKKPDNKHGDTGILYIELQFVLLLRLFT